MHPILENIANAIRVKVEQDLKNETIENLGLLDGACGILLFLHRYSKHTSNSIFSQLHDDYLNLCLEHLSQGFFYPAFCSGLSGVLYLLQHEYKDIVNITSVEDTYDNYLSSCLMKYLAEDNWDPLHGALGIAYYSLSRNNMSNLHQSLVQFFDKHSKVEKDGGRKIESIINPENGQRGFNISLSHGMSSIIVYLSLLYSKYKQGKVRLLLSEFICYILNQKIDFDTYGSCFPSKSKDEPINKSRLAWCYGDLGVAYSLYIAAISLNDNILFQDAISVLVNSCKRKSLKENYIHDACICHGTSGISLIYNFLYQSYPLPEFHEASVYWTEQTLKMNDFSNLGIGYKSYNPITEKYYDEYNLLEGISGIGLSIMSSLYNEQWSDILFLKHTEPNMLIEFQIKDNCNK